MTFQTQPNGVRLLLFSFFICASLHAQNKNVVLDNEGNEYEYIQRNGYLIMVESLRTSTYNDGTKIHYAKNNKDWDAQNSQRAGVSCAHNYKSGNAKKYGLVYNQFALYEHGGIVPEGWYIPTAREWADIFEIPYKSYDQSVIVDNSKGISRQDWKSNPNKVDYRYRFRLFGGTNHYVPEGKNWDVSESGINLHAKGMGSLTQSPHINFWIRFYGSNSTRGRYVRCVKKVKEDEPAFGTKNYNDDRVYLLEFIKSIHSVAPKNSHFSIDPIGSDDPSVECISGDCMNGTGKAYYNKSGATFSGSFLNGYPEGSGVLINKINDTLFATFRNRGLDGAQFIKGTQGQIITIYTSGNSPYRVENLAVGGYAYYSGLVHADLSWKRNGGIDDENRLFNDELDLRVQISGDNEILGYYGSKIEKGKVIIAEFDTDAREYWIFNIKGKELLAYSKDGQTEYEFQVDSGELLLDYVIIRYGNSDSNYVGSVNEKWQPHGEGTFRAGKKKLIKGEWRDGVPIGGWDEKGVLFGTYKKRSPEEMDQAMSDLRKLINSTYPSGYSYFGRTDKEFRVNAKGQKNMLLVNLNKKPVTVEFKIIYDINKDFGLNAFINDQGWRTVVIPGSESVSSFSKLGKRLFTLDLTSYGGATVKMRNSSAKEVVVFIE